MLGLVSSSRRLEVAASAFGIGPEEIFQPDYQPDYQAIPATDGRGCIPICIGICACDRACKFASDCVCVCV